MHLRYREEIVTRITVLIKYPVLKNKGIYTRRLILALSHSRPSYRPSPEVAQAAYEGRRILDENRKMKHLAYLDIPSPLPQAL